MKLSIIIPVHNEQATIAELLRRVLAVDLGGWQKEILVVDDGSSDGSREIIKPFESAELRLIVHPKNLGKGAAIQTALKEATGDYIIIQDADLEYDPLEIPKLLNLIKDDKSAKLAVFGNRGIKRYPERGFHYVIGVKILSWTLNILFGVWLHDTYTGYKLIPTAIFRSLDIQSTGFEFEAEVTCKLIKRGCKIFEVQITNYRPRNKEQGKHIGFKDAFKGFWTILVNRVK